MIKRFGLLILIVIVLIGFIWLYYSFLQPKLMVEDVLPKDALFVMKMKHFDRFLDLVRDIGFLNKLGEESFQELERRSFFSHQQLQMISKAQGLINQDQSGLFLARLLLREFTLSAYETETQSSTEKTVSPSAAILMTVRLIPFIDVTEFLTRKILSLHPRIHISSRKFKDYTISKIHFYKQHQLFHVKIGDLLILSTDRDLIEHCISVVSGHRKSLQENLRYRSVAQRNFSSHDLLMFCDLNRILTQSERSLNNWMKNFPDSQNAKLFSQFQRSLQGLDLIYLNGRFEETAFISTFTITVNRNKAGWVISKLIDENAQENHTKLFIPFDAYAYFWMDRLALPDILSKINGHSRLNSSIIFVSFLGEYLKEMEGILGVPLEQELSFLLEKEWGASLFSIDSDKDIPEFNFIIFARVKDRYETNRLIRDLFGFKPETFTQKAYKQYNITDVAFAYQEQVGFSYCFIDQYVLLSNHSGSLMRALDAYLGDQESLLTQPSFVGLNNEIFNCSNSDFFIQFDRLLPRLKVFNRWMIDYFKKEEQQMIREKKQAKEQLALLSMNKNTAYQGIANFEMEEQSLKAKIAKAKKEQQDIKPLAQELLKIQERVDTAQKRFSAIKEGEEFLQNKIEYIDLFLQNLDPEAYQKISDQWINLFLESFEGIDSIVSQTRNSPEGFQGLTVVNFSKENRFNPAVIFGHNK